MEVLQVGEGVGPDLTDGVPAEGQVDLWGAGSEGGGGVRGGASTKTHPSGTPLWTLTGASITFPGLIGEAELA